MLPSKILVKALALVHQKLQLLLSQSQKLSPLSVNEMNDFYKSLKYCKIKPVALSLVILMQRILY